MGETLFQELKRYVGFGEADEEALRALHPEAAPAFGAIAEEFYRRALEHEGSRRALQGGESQVGHLKTTLVAWMDRLLAGPWDEAYFEARCRIGRKHVRIGLEQHYMFGAMNVIRRGLNQAIDDAYLSEPRKLRAARKAVGRILDLELAVMLHAYREDMLAERARSERLATFGQLVGSIGHELRNPLGVIETSLYLLGTRIGDDERARKQVDRIRGQVQLANGIITNLLDLIRDRPVVPESVRLADVVERAAEAVTRPLEVGFRAEGLADLPEVKADPGQIRQVFMNLIENAVHAASPQGEIRVRGRRGSGSVEIAVEDTGPGVDPVTRRRLFEPLVTTKESGIGLGLALVKRIVERHGGAVWYDAPESGGGRFTVRLPT
jgi:signal transduction histidine kinase